ncbi:hypothetical protein JTE90_003900 [Oedothorax gibbosus]|uniref:Uncharacterized protein n=1 Tax=Oedothorax gibbosus TaxID=931172 RepID=A0AAV6UHL0_9ARAC|nr:hypothetical protein JTE90_003900 [Oedothorax gibbosus]
MADCEEDKKVDDVVSVNENQQSTPEHRIEAINTRVSCTLRKLFGSYKAFQLNGKDDACKRREDDDDDDLM